MALHDLTIHRGENPGMAQGHGSFIHPPTGRFDPRIGRRHGGNGLAQGRLRLASFRLDRLHLTPGGRLRRQKAAYPLIFCKGTLIRGSSRLNSALSLHFLLKGGIKTLLYLQMTGAQFPIIDPHQQLIAFDCIAGTHGHLLHTAADLGFYATGRASLQGSDRLVELRQRDFSRRNPFFARRLSRYGFEGIIGTDLAGAKKTAHIEDEADQQKAANQGRHPTLQIVYSCCIQPH
jgi:hypothetical protein